MAPTIRVAEAAKVIENSQRDINIAFMNELSLIFNRLNIDTNAVLEAAGYHRGNSRNDLSSKVDWRTAHCPTNTPWPECKRRTPAH